MAFGWLLFAVSLLTVLTLTRCDVAMKFDKINCIVHDPTIIKKVRCSAKPINRMSTLISMSGNLARQLDSLFVNGALYKKTDVRYQPFLVNATDNYCEFFSKNRASIYLRMAAPIFLPYTNLNHTCPYSGTVYVKNLPLDWSQIRTMWPAGDYRLDVLLYQIGTNIGTIQVYLKIKDVLQDLKRPRRSIAVPAQRVL